MHAHGRSSLPTEQQLLRTAQSYCVFPEDRTIHELTHPSRRELLWPNRVEAPKHQADPLSAG